MKINEKNLPHFDDFPPPPDCSHGGCVGEIVCICRSYKKKSQVYTIRVECGSQIHCVNSARRRLIQSAEESQQSVLELYFWVGVWKRIRQPLTCFPVCTYSCSLTLHLSSPSPVSHTHTQAHTLGFSHCISLRYRRRRRKNHSNVLVITPTHMCARVCECVCVCVRAGLHVDKGDTPSVKLLSRICASYCDSVESAYWSSLAEILPRYFHNSIWHKPTTGRKREKKRIKKISKFFSSPSFSSLFLTICDGFFCEARSTVWRCVNGGAGGKVSELHLVPRQMRRRAFDCHHLLSSLPPPPSHPRSLPPSPVNCSHC